MRILFITFEPPGNCSGGGLVVKQSLLSLSKIYEIDYLGPEISDEESSSVIRSVKFLKHNSYRLKRALNVLSGITTGYYESWMKVRDQIDWSLYDSVHLEFSRYDFVSEYVKKKNKKLVIRVHNVEHDYYKNLKEIKRTLRSWLRYKYIFNQETKCLSQADLVICLTEQDKKRLLDLYAGILLENKIETVPVCLKKTSGSQLKRTGSKETLIKKPYILITGSLWYGPNADGVQWFIRNVWEKAINRGFLAEKNYQLVLAGARSSKKIKALVSETENIEFIDSPEDMSPYFENAEIYIAPVFTGAGMKVKVAEALSYGLPVIGTSHAFIGYKVNNREGCFLADSAEEFLVALERYSDMDQVEKGKIKKAAFQKYLENYSIESSIEWFREILTGDKE